MLTLEQLSEINKLINERRTLLSWLAADRAPSSNPQSVEYVYGNRALKNWSIVRVPVPPSIIQKIIAAEVAVKRARLAAIERRLNQLDVSLEARNNALVSSN